ncbi:MAG TPA: hypothetical protein DCY20_09275 [Firmicutes bacterium]|nr:hypothetical protein [Bacillota bacterium]
MEKALNVKQISIKELVINRSYIKVLLATLVSRFGDSIDALAYSWMVYMLTGSKVMMGSILAVNAIPSIFFSVFFGGILDYLSKKKVIIIGDIARGLVVCLTAVLFLTKQLQPWHLFVLTFVTSTIEAFVKPCKSTIMPMILKHEELMAANSFYNSASSFAELVGIGLAGVIISVFGIAGALFIDGLTFFISCLIMSTVKIPKTMLEGYTFTIKEYFSNLKEGISFITSKYMFVFCMIGLPLMNFLITPINVLEPVYANEIMKAGPEAMSMIGMGLTLGMILGGIILAQYGSQIQGKKLCGIGLLVFGFAYAGLSLPAIITLDRWLVFAIPTVCFFIIGSSIPFISTPLSTYLMGNTPKHLLGRVISVFTMFSSASIPVAASLTGIISEVIQISTLFTGMGLGVVACAIFVLSSRNIDF